MSIEYRIDRLTRRTGGGIDAFYTTGEPPLPTANFKFVREFASLDVLSEELLRMREGMIDPLLFAVAATLAFDPNLAADITDKSIIFDHAIGSMTRRG